MVKLLIELFLLHNYKRRLYSTAEYKNFTKFLNLDLNNLNFLTFENQKSKFK